MSAAPRLPPPAAPDDLAPLRAARAALAERLAARLAIRPGSPPADDAERERLRGEIVALFRAADARLREAAALKEEVKALVALWKALPSGDAARDPPAAAPVAAGGPTASRRVDHLGASTFVARGWSALARGDAAEAEEALARAVDLTPGEREATVLLAWALAVQERHDEALLAVQPVLAADPADALARLVLGIVCLRRGIHGEAIEHLARVVREDGDRKATLYAAHHLGLVYLRREMYDDAVAFFRRALQLGPNLVEAHHAMGRALWLAGDRAAALEAWRVGAGVSKFNPWSARCDEVRRVVEQGGEPAGLGD